MHACACAQVPCGAAGHYLLGRICALSNRHDSAVAHFCDALRADSLLWCAYEELCALGEGTKAEELMGGLAPVLASHQQQQQAHMQQQLPANAAEGLGPETPWLQQQQQQGQGFASAQQGPPPLRANGARHGRAGAEGTPASAQQQATPPFAFNAQRGSAMQACFLLKGTLTYVNNQCPPT